MWSKVLNRQKPLPIAARRLKSRNTEIQFQVAPTMCEPRLKFETRLPFFKFFKFWRVKSTC